MGRGRRRPKNQRQCGSDEDDEDGDHYFYNNMKQEQNKKLCRATKTFVDNNKDDDNYDQVLDEDDPPDETIEKTMLAFCCSNCTCSDEKKAKTTDSGQFIKASENLLWHRRCCHNVLDFRDDWKSSLEKAYSKRERALLQHNNVVYNDTVFLYKQKELRKKYLTSKQHESEFFNEDTLADPSNILETSQLYVNSAQEFGSIAKKRQSTQLQPAVVIEMFGGIGSGIVALKRLGIAIQKVIHVEIDQIAIHVYRWNHDESYNPNLIVLNNNNNSCETTATQQPSIEHVYYTKFEEIWNPSDPYHDNNFNTFVFEHGPVDIIIGGPPCVDYSAVNANRKGVCGRQGKYMIEFGNFVTALKQKQKHEIFYLAENTVLRNHKDMPISEGDLSQIEKAFNNPVSIELDSKEVSPCRRKRTYITNIPFYPSYEHDYNSANSIITSCLDDNYKHPGNVYEKDMIAKANCFMAHSGRINDDRMLVVCENPDYMTKKNHTNNFQYLCRHITTTERERAMGFPSNYVKTPVNDLFDALLHAGFANGVHWKKLLDEKYHHFSGNYHNLRNSSKAFRFKYNQFRDQLDLKLAAPQRSAECFNKDEYAKHLIGNAFSIPTITMLLRPLQQMYSSCKYDGYDYEYYWIPYLEASNTTTTNNNSSLE